jgi:16S rRNA processing protein RimM
LTSRSTPNLIEIGRVARAHGVRGEIRVVLHWEDSDSLEHVGEVTLRRARDSSERTFEVRGARAADRAVLLSLAGVNDRDAADALRGSIVCVSRAELPPLEDGEYYLCDLVGATVVSPEGVVGEVVEVRVHPTVDTLVLRTPDGALVEQPIVDPWIQSVDVGQKRVELTSTDGIVGP